MKIQVALIMGGVSVEHEISVISALQAYHAIDKEKYDVTLVYIAKSGELYVGERLADLSAFEDMDGLIKTLTQVAIIRKDGAAYIQGFEAALFKKPYMQKIDVAFPVVHGTNCEDGTVAGLLEAVRVPYVGCDILGSAIGMDKAVMKQVLAAEGVPCVPFVQFYTRDFISAPDSVLDKCETLSYPVIVKPVNLGSSVGIKKASNRAELETAIDLAGSFANRIIVEKAIEPLREINCAVLGNYASQQASTLEEPLTSDKILSYTDKYATGSKGSKGMSSLKRRVPTDLSEQKCEEIKNTAKKAFEVLHASGVARVDFLLDSEQNIYVNEINTIPGSLSFYLWEGAGKSFSALCDELIELAFTRARERDGLCFSFEQNIFATCGTKGITGKK